MTADPLVQIDHRYKLADMVVETMQNNNCSLLEAYVSIQRLASEEYTLSLAKKKIDELNEGKA